MDAGGGARGHSEEAAEDAEDGGVVAVEGSVAPEPSLEPPELGCDLGEGALVVEVVAVVGVCVSTSGKAP